MNVQFPDNCYSVADVHRSIGPTLILFVLARLALIARLRALLLALVA